MSDTTLAPVTFPPSLEMEDDATLPALDQNARVRELAATINLQDPGLTVTYGTGTMTEISKFADDLLSRIRAKDAGPVGETLTELMVRVKDLNLTEFAGKQGGFLENIPLVGSLFNSATRTIVKFNTLAGQVQEIADKLDQAMIGLLRDIEILEQLYGHNKTFYDELSLYIAAGKERIEQARNVELPRLKEEVEASNDNMAAQNMRDFAEAINRFDRRLHDLQLSRTITLQAAPQIRLIQNNNQALAEKIQTSILATIPIWKSQMVLALSLYGQKNAAKLQKDVADTTNELLRRNADMLQSGTVETAREVERSVVDIETLQKVHTKLLSTIEETLRISQEAKEKRQNVEKELAGMEQNLRVRLTELATAKSVQAIEQAGSS